GTGGGGDNTSRILRGRSSGNHTDLVLHERNVGHEVDNGLVEALHLGNGGPVGAGHSDGGHSGVQSDTVAGGGTLITHSVPHLDVNSLQSIAGGQSDTLAGGVGLP